MIRIIVFAIMVAFVISLLIDGVNAQGSRAENDACRHEAIRWCKHELSGAGPFTIAACMAAHRARLSAACRKVLADHGL